tara:strand:+ start:632 stop:1201 length:570 start_codon:yes stop_codon:yes gene_type:complete
MRYDKNYLRNRFLLQRKKKYLKPEKFNFHLIFKLITKHFHTKKIVIGGYYPSDHEVNILNFLEKASEKKFKIALPVVKSSTLMCFNSWIVKDPLYVSEFGILEPRKEKKEIIPDIIIVPLVAFDSQLNRIGYGKGYYDRCLRKIKKIKKNAIFLGMAYYFQKCKNIPVNKHDFKLHYIFTERGIISSNK